MSTRKKLLQVVDSFIEDKNGTSYFYMAPLITKTSCLQCHAKQGYVEGDIRGGISIITPFTTVGVGLYPITLADLLSFITIWLLTQKMVMNFLMPLPEAIMPQMMLQQIYTD